jgi:5'-methylthioadenosine phosphorylase
MVVIQGPRFSTRAESAWFTREGWDVVGMTQHPEAILARELGICYTGIALVTDYDTGVAQGREAVSIEEVFRVFRENIGKVQELIRWMVPRMVGERRAGHPGYPEGVDGACGCECEEEARRAVVG